jgi:hypothetical protein
MAKQEEPKPQVSVRIAFSSAGKDFHLEVRGGSLGDAEKTFERLFEKVKNTTKNADGSHYG